MVLFSRDSAYVEIQAKWEPDDLVQGWISGCNFLGLWRAVLATAEQELMPRLYVEQAVTEGGATDDVLRTDDHAVRYIVHFLHDLVPVVDKRLRACLYQLDNVLVRKDCEQFLLPLFDRLGTQVEQFGVLGHRLQENGLTPEHGPPEGENVAQGPVQLDDPRRLGDDLDDVLVFETLSY